MRPTSGSGQLDHSVANRDMGRLYSPTSSWNCSNWRSTSGSGAVLGAADVGSSSCSTPRRLACCSTVYRERFVGLAPATTGNGGGRAGMHARCANEYPGSHMCHAAEYVRAHPTALPPAGGVWVDASSIDTALNHTAAVPRGGRFTGPTSSWNCSGWTSNAGSGAVLSAADVTSASCGVSRPVACCE